MLHDTSAEQEEGFVDDDYGVAGLEARFVFCAVDVACYDTVFCQVSWDGVWKNTYPLRLPQPMTKPREMPRL